MLSRQGEIREHVLLKMVAKCDGILFAERDGETRKKKTFWRDVEHLHVWRLVDYGEVFDFVEGHEFSLPYDAVMTDLHERFRRALVPREDEDDGREEDQKCEQAVRGPHRIADQEEGE